MNMLRIKAAISLVSVLTLSGFNLICISTASAQEIHLEDQLIMFLPMTGNAADSSGMDVPTTLKGPELTSDRYDNPNSAYLFDGFDDFITINNNQALITSMEYTICMWARMDGPSYATLQNNSLFEQRDANTGVPVVIHFNAGYGEITRHVVRTSAEGTLYRADTEYPGYGEWHHFVAMVDATRTMYVFIDGELRSTNLIPNNGNFHYNIQYVSIGAHHPEHINGGAFNGAIDDVYIYNRALNLCEIEALYSGQLLEER